MDKTLFFSSAAKLPLCRYWTFSISFFLSLVMATVFSRVVFSLQHTASSHCPAVTRAHISTGRPAVLYWKSHCYATYIVMPAALLVCLFISLHWFFTCLATLEHDLGHILTALSDIVKKSQIFIERPALVWNKHIYESFLGTAELCVLTFNRCWHKSLHNNENLCKYSLTMKRWDVCSCPKLLPVLFRGSDSKHLCDISSQL